MSRWLLLLLPSILIFSCAKEDVETFDNNIGYAHDFAIDPASGDTVYSIYIPSGFTPNGDGINELYLVSGIGIKRQFFAMKILNRYNNVVFSSTDLWKGWSGAIQGQGILSGSGYTMRKLH